MLVLFPSCCSTSQATEVRSCRAPEGDEMCSQNPSIVPAGKLLYDHRVQRVAFSDKTPLWWCPHSHVATGHRNGQAQRFRCAAGMAQLAQGSQGRDAGTENVLRSFSYIHTQQQEQMLLVERLPRLWDCPFHWIHFLNGKSPKGQIPEHIKSTGLILQ